MLAILRQLQSIFLAIGILFTSLISTGAPVFGTKMPDTEPGVYGQWVNPFIGTGGYPWVGGNMYPGATAPFGAVKLSPDSVTPNGTNLFNWASSGYHYGDTYILGFSHTRLSGTGARDMGHFRVTPNIGSAYPLDRLSKPLIFSHDDEVATAGYYAVYLSGIKCMAELTASEHVGAHRYTFGTDKDALIYIDATSFLYDGRAFDGKISIDENGMITGEALVDTQFTGRYGGLKAYFAAKTSVPSSSYSFWQDGELAEGVSSAAGDDCGITLNFGNRKNQPIELLLAISFVSTDNAIENLEAEAGSGGFDAVRAQTRDTWDSYLSRIDIDSDDDEIKTVFYTALYHSMLMPTTYTDVNGEYLGFKNTVGTADGYTYRSDMSLWDTFRTTHPLYILIAPEIQRDCLNSLVNMAETGGSLPRWPSGGGYTNSMFGTPADMVIAESYLKGITDFDVESAYEYMVLGSDSPAPEGGSGRNAVTEYNTYGYVPADVTDRSVSYTLEYCWADASIALLAEALGKTDDAERFTAKSLWYKNLFDTDTKYFRAKNSDGSWVLAFDPSITSFYDEVLPVKFASPYTEGSARHWRWTALQDTKGLIDLFGGQEYFVSELEQFMADASADLGSIDPGSGYWIGNEHDMHTAYLFDEAGSPELTQKWVRWTLAERYKNSTSGLDGNEDGGALSAWYVWSAIGLYPVAGTDRYLIGSPNVASADVNMGGGKHLNVIAVNQSAENIYVQSVTFNGEALTSPDITHSLIANGGELVFTMGSEPAVNGGF